MTVITRYEMTASAPALANTASWSPRPGMCMCPTEKKYQLNRFCQAAGFKYFFFKALGRHMSQLRRQVDTYQVDIYSGRYRAGPAPRN